MTSLKLVSLLVFLYISTYQVSESRIIEGKEISERNILEIVLEKAKQILINLQKLITGLVDSALNVLKELQTTVITVAKNAIEGIIKQIEGIVGNAKGIMDKIIHDAEQTGANIKECMYNVERLNKLPAKLIGNEIKCVTTEVETAQRIINETIHTVTNIYNQVTTFPTRLQQCVTDPMLAVKCVYGVIADMLKLQVTAPVEIDREVRAALEFVTGFKSRVTTCGTNQVTAAKNESIAIVDNMRKCVQNIIP